ncbi:hypothetical protein [Chroococcidiopsis sp.]|uniref:hypothetical protein n=1 Tax=Chroococcidiopsis sp. TaxID=3088168 RepID=UPI003F38B204
MGRLIWAGAGRQGEQGRQGRQGRQVASRNSKFPDSCTGGFTYTLCLVRSFLVNPHGQFAQRGEPPHATVLPYDF